MQKRAERVDETRLRITEAAVRLHTTIGPSESSLSAIAEEAGVTRLTLYRHFPTRDELFSACMGHWQALHPMPDPALWMLEADFERRVQRAVQDLYRWYGVNGEELYPIYRDVEAAPASNLEARAVEQARLVDAVLSGTTFRGHRRRRVIAAVGHATGFWTWRSLVVDQGLSTAEAVDLVHGFVLSAVGGDDAAVRR